jgi:hypothetical protein
VIGSTFATAMLALAVAPVIFAQNTVPFTGIIQTDEQAIQLTWASVSNEVYQVQCAKRNPLRRQTSL